MTHVWCHGPNCHTYSTVDRVRGSKGSKVLRTRKVKQWVGDRGYTTLYDWFCSQGCYNEFANKYVEQIIRIAPRTEPLETPVNVREETQVTRWDGYEYKTKVIDKLNNVG